MVNELVQVGTSYTPVYLGVTEVTLVGLTITLHISSLNCKAITDSGSTLSFITKSMWDRNSSWEMAKHKSHSKSKKRMQILWTTITLIFCDKRLLPTVLVCCGAWVPDNGVQIEFGRRSLTLPGHGTAIPLSGEYMKEVISLSLAVLLPAKNHAIPNLVEECT